MLPPSEKTMRLYEKILPNVFRVMDDAYACTSPGKITLCHRF